VSSDSWDNFWSWFSIAMRDELAACDGDDQRNFITQTWLLTAPAAGSC
jgi:hypothetical protein